ETLESPLGLAAVHGRQVGRSCDASTSAFPEAAHGRVAHRICLPASWPLPGPFPRPASIAMRRRSIDSDTRGVPSQGCIVRLPLPVGTQAPTESKDDSARLTCADTLRE